MLRFLKDDTGNIAPMTVIALVPIIALMGGMIDLVRVTTAKDELQRALDAATLASASLTQTGDVQETVESYLLANLKGSDLVDSLEISVTPSIAYNSREVTIEATAKRTPLFWSLAGITEVDIKAVSAAAQSASEIEISMVLDISSSMNGKKLTNLQDAASEFVDEMLQDDQKDTLSISIVPFGGTVNLGEDVFNDFVILGSSVITNPPAAVYDVGSAVVNLGAKFSGTDPTTLTPYGSRCIEHLDSDYDDWDMLPDNLRSQVPNFWKWTNFSSWCPHDGTELFVNSNDAAELKKRIKDFRTSDGTGLDVGVLWGSYTLSPEWQGYFGGDLPDRPLDIDERNLKIMVLMTDGEITAQYRPEDFTVLNVHTNRSNRKMSDGYKGNKGNSKNQQTILKAGKFTDPVSMDTAKAKTKRVCDNLKENGVIVYTIGFKIKKGKDSDKLMEYCASSPSHYYLVEDLDIAAAFSSISRSINSLRIVG